MRNKLTFCVWSAGELPHPPQPTPRKQTSYLGRFCNALLPLRTLSKPSSTPTVPKRKMASISNNQKSVIADRGKGAGTQASKENNHEQSASNNHTGNAAELYVGRLKKHPNVDAFAKRVIAPTVLCLRYSTMIAYSLKNKSSSGLTKTSHSCLSTKMAVPTTPIYLC